MLQVLCECGDPGCVESVEMPLRQFQRVSRHEGRFVVLTGHEPRSGAHLVERHAGWSVEYVPK